MCRKIIGLMLSLLSVLWLGAACGSSPGGNADNGNISVAANSNSAKTTKQTDTTPVTIGIDALMSERFRRRFHRAYQ